MPYRRGTQPGCCARARRSRTWSAVRATTTSRTWHARYGSWSATHRPSWRAAGCSWTC